MTTVETKTIDLTQLKTLAAQYDEAQANWEAKKRETETAYRKMSDIVKAISETITPETKFRRNGEEHTIVQRGETYFLRSPKKNDKQLLEI